MVESIPAYISQSIHNWFDFPHREVYAHVATTDKKTVSVRTMVLFDITVQGKLVFLSRIDSRKCYDLKKMPMISACLHHAKYGQILAEGTATIETFESNEGLCEIYWEKVPHFIKKIFLPTGGLRNNKIPENFCVIMVEVERWELLENFNEDYVKNNRVEFLKVEDKWEEKQLRLI